MLEMNNFIEFLFKSILEQTSDGELPIWFSNRFRDIINNIFNKTGNEIAQRLSYEEGRHGKKVFVDIDDNDINKFSFLISNKVEDILGRTNNLRFLTSPEEDEIYKARQRGTMKISSFINDLFNNEYKSESLTDEQKEENKRLGRKTPAQILEEFVNAYKAAREPGKFELVKGSDIPYWYYELNYETQNASLGDSCMKGEECESFFNFYAKNSDKVSLLIMKSRFSDNKIIGRALVWDLTEPEGRIYMDRIYVNYEHDYENFKNYARNKGWLFKKEQNMYADETIVDSKTNESKEMILIVRNMKPNETYPYLDTLKYYNPTNEVLSNNADIVKELPGPSYILEDTEGYTHPLKTYTREELIDMYTEDVLGDLRFYATEMYPNTFWNYIDDEKYMNDFKSGELNYYLDDFEHFLENNERTAVRYIVENIPSSKWNDDIYSMNTSELIELIDKLNIRNDIAMVLIDERYDDYTAKDVHKELYGHPDNIDRIAFDNLGNYFNAREFAKEVARNEDEDYLRERYPEDES